MDQISQDLDGDRRELCILQDEIKRLNKVLYDLRQKRQKIEQRIINYLAYYNQTGIRDQRTGLLIERKTKIQRTKKPQKEKEKEIEELLHSYGIGHTEKAIKEILEAVKGEKKEKQAIVVKTETK